MSATTGKGKPLQFSFDQSTLKILYYRHKAYLLPVGIILACLILFFVVITSQLHDLFSSQSQTENLRSQVSVLQNNLSLLSGINQETQEKEMLRATKGLPVQKDYGGILVALSEASRNSSVPFSDFSFQVGDLSSPIPAKSPLSLSVTLTLKSGVVGTKRFLSELGKTLPISSVSDIQIAGNSSNVTISFYYKPFAVLKPDYALPIPTLSNKDAEILNTLGK